MDSTTINKNFYVSDNIKTAVRRAFRPEHGLVFILVLSGKAVIKTNNKEYVVKQGVLMSIVPLQSYTITKQSDTFNYGYIAFNLDFMADFQLLLKPHIAEKMDRQPCLHLDKENFKLFKEYYRNTIRQYKKYKEDDNSLRITLIKACLFIIITEITLLYSTQRSSTKQIYTEQIVDDFFGLLHASFREEHKPEFYSDKLHISPKHLTKIVKKVTGQTTYSWICEFIIRESKILLQSTDLTVSQISDELNFPNSSYFARYFKKYANMSPVEFRRKK